MFPVRLHWKSDLNTYRVEASWKLGQWDLLEDYLSSGSVQGHTISLRQTKIRPRTRHLQRLIGNVRSRCAFFRRLPGQHLERATRPAAAGGKEAGCRRVLREAEAGEEGAGGASVRSQLRVWDLPERIRVHRQVCVGTHASKHIFFSLFNE